MINEPKARGGVPVGPIPTIDVKEGQVFTQKTPPIEATNSLDVATDMDGQGSPKDTSTKEHG
jgi:hypothetical protein